MRKAFKILIATGVLASAQVAYGQELPPPSDCETSEQGCGHPTPTPTPLPNVPSAVPGRSATFFVGQESGAPIQGGTYYPNNVPTIFLFGAGNSANRTLDDSLFSYGTSDANISFQTSTGAIPSVSATASLADIHGRADISALLGYSIVLHAGTDAIADQLQSLIPSGRFASAFGITTLSAAGIGSAGGYAYNGFGLPNHVSPLSSILCDTGSNSGGCGTRGFNFGVQFIRGNQFADGVSSDFYAVLNLNAVASSGYDGLGHMAGSASAYVDPQIRLNQRIVRQFGNLSLTTNGVGNGTLGIAGAVPEPSIWAMMIVGFGMIGAGMRRRKREQTAAIRPAVA